MRPGKLAAMTFDTTVHIASFYRTGEDFALAAMVLL
jgi:hypothetical protein